MFSLEIVFYNVLYHFLALYKEQINLIISQSSLPPLVSVYAVGNKGIFGVPRPKPAESSCTIGWFFPIELETTKIDSHVADVAHNMFHLHARQKALAVQS